MTQYGKGNTREIYIANNEFEKNHLADGRYTSAHHNKDAVWGWYARGNAGSWDSTRYEAPQIKHNDQVAWLGRDAVIAQRLEGVKFDKDSEIHVSWDSFGTYKGYGSGDYHVELYVDGKPVGLSKYFSNPYFGGKRQESVTFDLGDAYNAYQLEGKSVELVFFGNDKKGWATIDGVKASITEYDDGGGRETIKHYDNAYKSEYLRGDHQDDVFVIDGYVKDYTIKKITDDKWTVTSKANGTTDTLVFFDAILFKDELVDIENYGGGGGGSRNEIIGTSGDDYLVGTDGNDWFKGGDGVDVMVGGKGDDYYDGEGGNYNQVDFLGSSRDYKFTSNSDGTITVKHAVYGTDTLKNIDGAWFVGDSVWKRIDDLVSRDSKYSADAQTLNYQDQAAAYDDQEDDYQTAVYESYEG